MGGNRFTANRKQGVYHYLDHMGFGPECKAPRGFECAMMKPYPARDEDKPWFKMIERWNAAQVEVNATLGERSA